MTEQEILELIYEGGFEQYVDITHPNFDLDTTLLLIDIKPELFSAEQRELFK